MALEKSGQFQEKKQRKNPEIIRFQDFSVRQLNNHSPGLVEISGIEPLLFVCLKDSQEPKTKKKTNLSVGLGGDKRDRTADLLNAIGLGCVSLSFYSSKRFICTV